MTFRYRDREYHRGVDAHLREIGGDIDMAKIPQEWGDKKTASELLPSPMKDREYVKVRDIAGGPVMVRTIGDWGGSGDPTMKSGPSLLVTADLVDGGGVWFIVSHQVLYRKLNELREAVPFVATFYKVDKKRYFDVE